MVSLVDGGHDFVDISIGYVLFEVASELSESVVRVDDLADWIFVHTYFYHAVIGHFIVG